MDDRNKKINNALEEAAKSSIFFTATPSDIKKLQAEGHPIKEKFTTFSEYVEKLYAEKKIVGIQLLHRLPVLDETIANNVVTFQYEDLRASVATVNATSIIIDSILLLEYSLRLSIFRTIRKDEPKYKWTNLEQMNFKTLISRLKKHHLITKQEKKELDSFNKRYRNIYLHMNIYKMSEDRVMPELDSINLATGEKKTLKNIKIVEYEALWFVGKKLFDKDNCLNIMAFCVNWTNELLKEKKDQEETKNLSHGLKTNTR